MQDAAQYRSTKGSEYSTVKHQENLDNGGAGSQQQES